MYSHKLISTDSEIKENTDHGDEEKVKPRLKRVTNLGIGTTWKEREELYKRRVENLTQSEIRTNIQFQETSDLLILVKNIRRRKDHAAIRILQRHLEELSLLKHILYERGFYLNSNSAEEAAHTKYERFQREEETTRSLAEYTPSYYLYTIPQLH